MRNWRIHPLEPLTFSRVIRVGIVMVSLVGVGMVGLFDWMLGGQLSLEVFYAVFIFLAVWYGSTVGGVITAVWAAIVWTRDGSFHARGLQWYHVVDIALRVLFFVGITFVLSRWRQVLWELKNYALMDPLTNLLNYRGFSLIANQILAGARRNKTPLTMIFVDVDNMKTVNDTWGHLEGDKALSQVGRCLRHTFRRSDVIARVGGDEFVILLENTVESQARHLVKRLRSKLLETLTAEGGPSVHCSLGVVTFQEPPESVQEMIREADRLMYEAKSKGKDRAIFRTLKP